MSSHSCQNVLIILFLFTAIHNTFGVKCWHGQDESFQLRSTNCHTCYRSLQKTPGTFRNEKTRYYKCLDKLGAYGCSSGPDCTVPAPSDDNCCCKTDGCNAPVFSDGRAVKNLDGIKCWIGTSRPGSEPQLKDKNYYRKCFTCHRKKTTKELTTYYCGFDCDRSKTKDCKDADPDEDCCCDTEGCNIPHPSDPAEQKGNLLPSGCEMLHKPVQALALTLGGILMSGRILF